MPFVSVPTELIDLIVNNLDVSATCSLRLACSPLNQESLHVFRGTSLELVKLVATGYPFIDIEA
ncbi:hypothetical protein BDU57DRAFT_514164 [Ampelomyces quisqualis]|uniref:F-box domain-containing protein n=1 Tax=Ampelomyces quisqualis TaxID=50730 RepID=A0A6A5QV21_AMPQU|nr:hypothetical protein BDU57DRAFT_514164 [Ampelomyces quisqualis]